MSSVILMLLWPLQCLILDNDFSCWDPRKSQVLKCWKEDFMLMFQHMCPTSVSFPCYQCLSMTRALSTWRLKDSISLRIQHWQRKRKSFVTAGKVWTWNDIQEPKGKRKTSDKHTIKKKANSRRNLKINDYWMILAHFFCLLYDCAIGLEISHWNYFWSKRQARRD